MDEAAAQNHTADWLPNGSIKFIEQEPIACRLGVVFPPGPRFVASSVPQMFSICEAISQSYIDIAFYITMAAKLVSST